MEINFVLSMFASLIAMTTLSSVCRNLFLRTWHITTIFVYIDKRICYLFEKASYFLTDWTFRISLLIKKSLIRVPVCVSEETLLNIQVTVTTSLYLLSSAYASTAQDILKCVMAFNSLFILIFRVRIQFSFFRLRRIVKTLNRQQVRRIDIWLNRASHFHSGEGTITLFSTFKRRLDSPYNTLSLFGLRMLK